MAEKQNAYEVITGRVIEALESGAVPWRKPWSIPEHGQLRNARTNTAYRGINVPMLALSAQAAGYSEPRWLTYRQAESLGGNVRRGEKSTPLIFWKWLAAPDKSDEAADDDAPARRGAPMLRRFNVFNVEQCDGLARLALLPEPGEAHTVEPLAAAQAIADGYADGPTIAHDGGSRAYYRPAMDAIHLPARDTFESAETYHATQFHELGHSTGHPSRLARKDVESVAAFGSADYSREELVAEFTSAFLLGEAGIIDPHLEQTAAYISGWLRVLRKDHRLAVQAAATAQKAADHILGRTYEPAAS